MARGPLTVHEIYREGGKGGERGGHIVGSPAVRVFVEERFHAIAQGESFMRLVFQTTLTVDIGANDDAARAAFTELVKQAARQVYGPSAMIAKGSPKMQLTLSSREGKAEIPLFNVTQESE